MRCGAGMWGFRMVATGVEAKMVAQVDKDAVAEQESRGGAAEINSGNLMNSGRCARGGRDAGAALQEAGLCDALGADG